MIPVFIKGANRVPGEMQKEYVGLPVRDEINELEDGTKMPVMASAWQPSTEEINALRKGGKIILRVGGTIQPPVILSVEKANGEELV